MTDNAHTSHKSPLRPDQVKDPVCGMPVARDQHALTYLQMHFAFCSAQCRQRFLANPGLYVGHPGHKAPVQQGQVVLKRRRLKLTEPLPAPLAQAILKSIGEMMGIGHIRIDSDTIEIEYDLLQVTEEQIESVLGDAGATLNDRWSERLRRAFVHYLEETEIASLEVSGSGGAHHH